MIGGGVGGYTAAIRAAQVGLKTALVEKGQELGGTCLLRGCIPTKELLHSAEIVQTVRDAEEFGVTVSGISFHFDAVQKRKDRIVRKLSKGVEYLMKKNKITVFNGLGKLEGKGNITVTGADGKKQTVSTKNVILPPAQCLSRSRTLTFKRACRDQR